MSYTIKNVQQVEDSAAKFGVGGLQEARFANDDLDVKDTGLSHHVIGHEGDGEILQDFWAQ